MSKTVIGGCSFSRGLVGIPLINNEQLISNAILITTANNKIALQLCVESGIGQREGCGEREESKGLSRRELGISVGWQRRPRRPWEARGHLAI